MIDWGVLNFFRPPPLKKFPQSHIDKVEIIPIKIKRKELIKWKV
jgi:hypothetical protein